MRGPEGRKGWSMKSEIQSLKSDCNEPKERLISVMNHLSEIGAVKEADQLEKIIIKLEVWQNR
jgi:threonine aldolase